MRKVEITIPDRLIELIETTKRENSEVVVEALNRYFDPSYKLMDLERWKFHIEKKLQDLQLQLDEHRLCCKSDVSFDLDSNATQRLSGKKELIDTDKLAHENRSLVEEVRNNNKPKDKPRSMLSGPKLDMVDVDLPI